MALFDSIIGETSERFDLTNDQVKALLSALLGLMTDSSGGFSGFLSRFRSANLGDAVSSWTTSSDNIPISKEQIEAVLGAETVAAVADRAGLDYATTVSATTFLLPQTIDRLTLNGNIPDEQTLRAASDDLVSDSNDSAISVTGTSSETSTEAFDRIGNASEDIAGKAHDMMSDDRINDPAAVGDRFSAAPAAISDQRLAAETYAGEFNDDSPLKWLVPLIITGLLIILGYWFCGKSSTTHASINAEPDFSVTTAINLNYATNPTG